MISSILKWLALVPAALLANFVGYLAAPFVVLFQRNERLPWWLAWFETPDNDLRGDAGWQDEHWQFRRKLPSWLGDYIGRVGWLWRNAAYSFDIDVLGFIAQPGHTFSITGDPRVSNRPLFEGKVFRKLTNPDGKVYFQWYFVKAWSATRCIRVNIGHKLWNIQEGVGNQFVVSINPWMGYSE